jgi:DNA-binding response OmpR family regulator
MEEISMKIEATEQKILIVDDNQYTLRILRFALERAGFVVMEALSGEDALAAIQTAGMPHLAIVDFNMSPGMDGFEFCRRVHQFSDLPVIMLTAVHDEDVLLEGLEQHCEDFIYKPFSPDVLVARVRRVLDRMGSLGSERLAGILVDSCLTIQFPQQTAVLNGKPIRLTPIETKLLYLLMRQAGKPVNTDYILRRIWPQEIAFEDRLHVHVHRLRRKIEHAPQAPYIVSKRGTGYIFQAN